MSRKRSTGAITVVWVFIWVVLMAAPVHVCFGEESGNEFNWRNFTGHKYIKNYTPDIYDSLSQNWWITQDRRGIIYAGNNGAILQYDGIIWRVIRLSPAQPVFSLDIDPQTGMIYVGARPEIGYLEPGKDGKMEFHSLLKHLDKNQRKFSSVNQVLCTPKGVWFRTSNSLLLWSGGKFTEWTGKTIGGPIFTIFPWKDSVVAHVKFLGLRRIDPVDGSGEFTLQPPLQLPDIFKDSKITLAAPYDKERLLIGTAHFGFFFFDGVNVTRFKTGADKKFRDKKFLLKGAALSGGNFMLFFSDSCLLVMDHNGRLKDRFDLSSGLQDDNVKYIFNDRGGNIWLALEKGITRIDYSSPFTYFDRRSGLEGLVLSAVRHKDRLWAGTTRGLYRLEPAGDGALPRFLKFKDAGRSCAALLSYKDDLFTADGNGIFVVEPSGTYRVKTPRKGYFLLASRTAPGRILAGFRNYLGVLEKKNGKWQTANLFKIPYTTINSIVENSDGSLWLGTRNGRAVKIEFPGGVPDTKTAIIKTFGSAQEVPGGEVFAAKAAGKMRLCTLYGFYRFEPGTGTFVPDHFLGHEEVGIKTGIFRLAEDSGGHLWFHSEHNNYHAIPRETGGYTMDITPFLRLPRGQVNAIYPELPLVWFATSGGLIVYNTGITKEYKQPYHALVRAVTVSGDKKIFSGERPAGSSTTPAPVLEYRQRNLKLRVAATFFDVEDYNRFRYFMEGYDTKWSDWSPGSTTDYTNLSAGNYRFRVQAMNIFGTPSIEDSFSFRVLPPWFLTWWAFIFYAAGAASSVVLIVKWRSHKLIKEKQHLETVIQERTREIYKTNVRLEQKTHQLEEQSEKLKEMDKVKSRFFANISHEFRTPLTLIMGPLDRIRSECSDDRLKEQINLVDRNAGRLLNLINQLLDLSQFESGKMKLEAVPGDLVSFFNGLVEPFMMVAKENNLEMTFETSHASIPLYFDPEKLEKVLANLLSNAVKFTPSGGSIKINAQCLSPTGEPMDSANAESGFVLLFIKDTGIGIPEEQLGHIFDRFYQAETTVEHFRKGSGIGLALVKELVDLHHAELTVSSQTGRGTEFTLRFQLGHAHLEPGEISRAGQIDAGTPAADAAETLKDLQPMEQDGREPDSREINGDTTEPGKREKNMVLVVEDNADLRAFIRGSLEPEFAVEEAGDGVKGLEKAKEIIPDLVISDIMMPLKDGYELCKELKSDIATSHIPVIMLTARVSEESVIHGLETGADDYITKPFNSRVLTARIKNLIELRRQFQLGMKREMVLQPSQMGISNIDKEFLEDLKKVIDKNIGEQDFNVEELSKKLYVSRVTLYRKIQALSGETPTDFIRSYRLKKAAHLLRNNFGSVTEVAFEVGFNSRAYFTKCFKEKFHQLPSEYLSSKTA